MLGGWWMVPIVAMVLFKEQTGNFIQTLEPITLVYLMFGMVVIDLIDHILSIITSLRKWIKE